jgi:hypothetical protein
MFHGTTDDQGAIKAYVVTSKDRWPAAPEIPPTAASPSSTTSKALAQCQTFVPVSKPRNADRDRDAPNFAKHLSEVLPQFSVEHLSAILGNEHHVVFALPLGVACRVQALHRRGRENSPSRPAAKRSRPAHAALIQLTL